jgi:hypothetical protein
MTRDMRRLDKMLVPSVSVNRLVCIHHLAVNDSVAVTHINHPVGGWQCLRRGAAGTDLIVKQIQSKWHRVIPPLSAHEGIIARHRIRAEAYGMAVDVTCGS